MFAYLIRQIASGLVALFVYLTALFFVNQWLMPGDFVTQFTIGMPPEETREFREELGLDLPLGQQYLVWLRGVLTGDLGTSFISSSLPVTQALLTAMPSTLLIFVSGTSLAFLVGLWLGIFTGWRGPGWISDTISLGGIALYTSFPPFLAFIVILLFVDTLGLFPPPFVADILYSNRELWQTSPFPPKTVMLYMVYAILAMAILLVMITWLVKRFARYRLPALAQMATFGVGIIILWQIGGFLRQGLEILRFATLPILTYSLLMFGETLLIMQTSMRDVLHEGYIQTARAKGLPDAAIRDRHAARNALLPVLSRLFVNLPYLLTGLVIVELAVGWPGLGGILSYCLANQDMPVVMGILLYAGLLTLAARLILDVVIALLDPRIRYGA